MDPYVNPTRSLGKANIDITNRTYLSLHASSSESLRESCVSIFTLSTHPINKRLLPKIVLLILGEDWAKCYLADIEREAPFFLEFKDTATNLETMPCAIPLGLHAVEAPVKIDEKPQQLIEGGQLSLVQSRACGRDKGSRVGVGL